MPELFRKVLCTTGTKHTPQGLLTLTPSRAERYARKFKQLRQKFRFPQPWGHKLSAMPEVGATDEEKQEANERRQFELARWNSGYIQDVEATKDGNLVIVGQVPPGYRVDMPSGDLINDRDGTRIGEVSGAFGNWKDGSGNYHKDILVHAALVTHPVDAGTGGFEKFEKADKVEPGMNMLSGAGEIEYTFFLSSRSPDMAKDKDDDKDDLDKLSGIDKSLEKGDKSPIEETVTEEDEYTPEPEPIIEPPAPIAPLPVTPLPPSGDLMPKIKQLEGMFGEMQISLPPSEDVATFVNNMLVAITVARSLGVKFNKPDDESANTQQTTMQSGQDKPPSPEAPPIMMSTLSGPALALAEREQNRMRSDTAKVWEENKKLGVPVSICDRESAKSETIMLSLTSTGKPKTHQRLKEARLVREVIQGVRGTINDQDQLLLKQLSSPPNPAEAANAIQVKETEEIHSAIKAGARSAASKMTVNTKV